MASKFFSNLNLFPISNVYKICIMANPLIFISMFVNNTSTSSNSSTSSSSFFSKFTNTYSNQRSKIRYDNNNPMRNSPYINEAYSVTSRSVFRLKHLKINNATNQANYFFGTPSDYKKSSDFERDLASRIESE